MADKIAVDSLALLRAAQQADGGWGHRGATSWTEPTGYALLALAAGGARADDETVARGLAWLKESQRADGGWPPQREVNQSTWVGALALLLPREWTNTFRRDAAVAWLMEQTGRQSSLAYRTRMFVLGAKRDDDLTHSGWPWFPNTTAWVVPTALTILALEREGPRTADRIADGRAYLLSRICHDGGWNQGWTSSLGFKADSNPENTGVALLALHGQHSREIARALDTAERMSRSSRSLEASSWLAMALHQHGRGVAGLATARRNVPQELAVRALAEAALSGNNILVKRS